MKKSVIIALASLCVLSLASLSFAKYVSGYKVVGLAEKEVTIKKGNDEPIAVSVRKVKYKVGDEVRYDSEKRKLRPTKLKKAFVGC